MTPIYTMKMMMMITPIYTMKMSLISLEKKVNNELKKLNLWLNVNRLSLNIAKTNFVIFRPYNNLKGSITIKINKNAIAEKSAIKY